MGEGQGGERKTASIHPLETFETLAFFLPRDLSYDDGNGSENFPEKWDSRCSKFHRSYSNSSSVCIVMFCTKPDVLLITFFNPIKSHTESLLDTCLSVASPSVFPRFVLKKDVNSSSSFCLLVHLGLMTKTQPLNDQERKRDDQKG